MNWIILIIAGLCEVGFTYCLGRAKGVAGYEWWTCAKIMETKTAVTTPTVSNPQFQREAIRFGKENGQQSVYVISSSTEIPIMQALDQRSLATERLRVGATAGMASTYRTFTVRAKAMTLARRKNLPATCPTIC